MGIVGGGLAGLALAYELHRLGVAFTLYEASPRLGGTVETVRREGFVIECGPDGWVTEKPWAAELATELGLAPDLITSRDETRVTYILVNGKLVPLPPAMRMMVPTDLTALESSALFTDAAREAYAAEPTRAAVLRDEARREDESVSSFVQRHFGEEVLHKLAAPLLSGVFGGDVRTLSVQAVMPAFVHMERAHGSLILGLQAAAAARHGRPAQPIFTSLRNGTATLIEALAATLPARSIRLETPIATITQSDAGWAIQTPQGPAEHHHLVIATPAHITAQLCSAILPGLAQLLPAEASSATIAALAFTQPLNLPQGFGFLVPSTEQSRLFACTFVDGKYPHRVPPGAHLIRAFFGGHEATSLCDQPDDAIATLALHELEAILGPLPRPDFTVIRHWPRSLPQYAVGHLQRIAQLDLEVAAVETLHLVGNAYRGVGLPDIIREGRTTARQIATITQR